MADDRPRSWEVTEGPQRAPARAMLRAVGFSEEDFGKSQIAVASSWNEVTPCNYHLDKLAALAKEGVRQGGAVPIEFTTIAVSDGIAMGHEGMKASPDQPRGDRRLGGARDARRAVRRPGGDRRLRQERAGDADGDGAAEPGVGLPVRRHDPGGHVPGPRHHDPGRVRGRRRARQRHDDDDELLQIERAACPTTGSCAGMYTANTMAAAAEAIGHVAPRRARRPPPSTTGARCSRASPGGRPPGCSRTTARGRATSSRRRRSRTRSRS